MRAKIKLWQPEEVERAKFAFFFHAPNKQYIREAFHVPNEWSEEVTQDLIEMDPFVPAPIKRSDQIIGVNLCVPWTPKMIMENLRLFRDKAVHALKFVQKFGVEHVGLGALVPSFLKNGRRVQGKVPGINITTGHGGTTIIMKQLVSRLMGEFNLASSQARIAIVGAAGTMGRTFFRTLSGPINNFLLVEKPKRTKFLKEEIVKDQLKEKPQLDIQITDSENLKELNKADIIVVATNAHRPFLKPKHLKGSLAVIDDAKPDGVGKETVRSLRRQTLVLECLAQGPSELNFGYDFGFAASNYCYSCAFEALAVAEMNRQSDFIIGRPSPEEVQLIQRWFNHLQIKPAPLTESGGRIIKPSEIAKVKEAHIPYTPTK